MTDSRAWLESLLDERAAVIPLDSAPDDGDDDGDEDETFSASDDESDESDELEEGDELEEDEAPYSPPTAAAIVEAVISGELNLGDMDSDAWFSWAISAPDAEWARAAAQAGYPDAERIKAHVLPQDVRIRLMQAELDDRVRQAKEGQRR